jgi:hypothetical protein
MVHALREAWRVLRPGGLLIDLRPAIKHRRLSLVRAGRSQPIGAMREPFDDPRAANSAVGRFRRAARARYLGYRRVDCERVMDGVDDLREWLADFMSRDETLPAHDWLVDRAAQALQETGPAKLVMAGPLDLRVLKKPDR